MGIVVDRHTRPVDHVHETIQSKFIDFQVA